MHVRWPFVGRREELELIGSAMADRRSPGIVLAGSAGVGKTHLLRTAVAAADPERFLAQSVVATAATSTIPFASLASLLPADLPGSANMRNLLGYVSHALIAPAGGRRLVVGVDDAHVLDETSAGLLYQLAQTGQAFVLASVRSGEEAPEPITALWKDDLVDRLEVQSLSHGEMSGVLHEVLGSQVDSATLQRFWIATGGNMLFLRELVAAGLDSGSLAELDGVWTWQGDWVIAPRLRELLHRRIGRLEPAELHALELVAYGEPVDSTVLPRLVDLDVLQAVEDKELLFEQGDDVFLAHPLYGELLRARCPALRSKRWKSKLADTIERAGAPRKDDWMRVATWRLDSGDPVTAETLMLAAQQAWAVLDAKLCERLVSAGIAAGAGLPAVKMLWRVLYLGNRHAEAEAFLSQWMLAPMPEADRADLVIGRAFHLFWGADEPERGIEVLREAERDCVDPAIRQEYTGLLALCFGIAGRVDDADVTSRGVLDGPVLSPHGVALALGGRLSVLTLRGGLADEVDTELHRIREVVRPWDDEVPFLGDLTDFTICWQLLFRGQLVEATTVAERMLEFALGHRTEDWARICQVGVAVAYRHRGRIASARSRLREAASRSRRQVGWTQGLGMQIFGELAHAEALLGRPEAAAAALAEAEANITPSYEIFRYFIEFARPWVLVAQGDRAAGIAAAQGFAQACRAFHLAPFELHSLHSVVRLNSASEVVDRLVELRSELGGDYARLFAAHAIAASAGDGPALEEVARGFERIGAVLLAAEVLAQSSLAYEKKGLSSSARAAGARAALLLSRCEGARTPALEAIRAPELTARELDIARLAAQGLSSKQIADRLVLSKRTIDNHLHQVYAKLGISGREALAGILQAGQE